MATYLKKIYPFLAMVILFAGLVISKPVMTEEYFKISEDVLKKAGVKYSKEAVQRLLAWEDLIRKNQTLSDMEKLKIANHFFNSMILYVSDIQLWRVEDYWATPFEFICKRAGDCEDYAIAKYFTLKAMGVEEEKLNIAYVKALQYNVHHMVLTYYSSPGAEPLVLDNIIDSIEPGSKRKDLFPIFSFNGTGLWMAQERGKGKLPGSSSRIKSWRNLLDRMSANQF
ncbi:MAG: transglutaminase-like cysteine peptidase [Pseudomonadota bacterium]